MTVNTAIEWCDHTWNPWQGCHKVSEGCKNCYMYRDMKRYGKTPDAVIRSAPATFLQPRQNKSWKSGDKVFVCSWSDFFHEAADAWRPEAWDLIRERDDVRYIIVTKRIERAAACLPPGWGEGWPHVAILVSVENQKRAGERIPSLLRLPAKIRGLSLEPLIDFVDISQWIDIAWQCSYCRDYFAGPHKEFCPGCGKEGGWCGSHKFNGKRHPHSQCGSGIDWVIVGAESGPDARLMDIEWAHRIAEECEAGCVPFFMKQICRKGRKMEYQDFPFDLRVRQFPNSWQAEEVVA